MLRVGLPFALALAVSSCGGHPPPASEVHLPPGIAHDVLGVGTGAHAVPLIVTKGIGVARGIGDATPDELKEMFRSSTCESLALMLSDHRFPSLAEEEGFITSSLALKGITQIPPQVLFNTAAALRGTLANALTDSNGVIPDETAKQAATAVGCHLAAGSG